MLYFTCYSFMLYYDFEAVSRPLDNQNHVLGTNHMSRVLLCFWIAPEPVVNFGEVWRTQLAKSTHSPHLHFVCPWDLSDLLRSVQILKRESGVRKAMGSYRTYSVPCKTAASVPEFVAEDCLRQNCSLGSCTCSERPALR